jgi:hypothetical protein
MISAHVIRLDQAAGHARGSGPYVLPECRCSKALIELCARIWSELERLANCRNRRANSEEPAFELLSEVLRLELVIIVDACESPAWGLMLDPVVRSRLSAMSTAVLSMLAVPPNALTSQVIECAQDRVFDEALNQCDVSADAHDLEHRRRPISN